MIDSKIKIAHIQQLLIEKEVDALWLISTVNIIYLLGRSINGAVLIPKEGEIMVFVRRPQGVEGNHFYSIRKLEDIASMVPRYNKMAFELDELSFNEAMRFQTMFSESKFVNASIWMREIRSIKTPREIELHRATGERHVHAMRQVPILYRKGMTDLEFSIEIERLFRREGSIGFFRVFGKSMEIFMGSVLAGDNADAPSPYDFALGGAGVDASLPIGCSGLVLKEGMSVMVDMGGCFSSNMTDLTRTYSIGELPVLAYKAHQLSIEIQNAIVDQSKEGVACADLYHLAKKMVDKAKLSDYFMGYSQQAGFVGHGVGLEINELPILHGRSKERLQKGQIIALEPKFVLPGVGAVGTENTYLMTESGLERITVMSDEIIRLDA